MMKGMGSMGQIRSYLLAKSEIIIWWCRENYVTLRR